MNSHTTTKYYVASYAGLIFATIAGIAATSIIVQDAFPNGPADWSHARWDHALAPVLVAITAFLWLHAVREAKEWKLSAIPLAALAVFCSGLIIFESMGRGAESLDTKIKTAEISVSNREAQTATLIDTRRYLSEQLPKMKTECLGAPVPLPPNGWHKCRWFTGTVSAYRETIARIEGELKTAPVAVVDARGSRVEFLAAWAGYDGAKAKQAAQSLYPLARPLAFEFVMIMLLHASVRTRKVSVSVADSVSTVSEPRALSFEGPYTDDEIEQIKKALNGMDRPVTNDELAALLGCTKSECSKRWKKAAKAGVLEGKPNGRYVHLKLVKAV